MSHRSMQLQRCWEQKCYNPSWCELVARIKRKMFHFPDQSSVGQEREALKAQERAAAEAEEARKRRVVVTLDLLGRQVPCNPSSLCGCMGLQLT